MGKRTQTFTSPGTWTNPNPLVVKRVNVIVVGGGGGGAGGAAPPVPTPTVWNGMGGGGAIRTANLPVSGPAPVVVGAGGAGGTAAAGAIGGSSSFNPGPTGLTADGGGGATNTSGNVPSIGGGAGVVYVGGFTNTTYTWSGGLGAPSSPQYGGPAYSHAAVSNLVTEYATTLGQRLGFGGGGGTGDNGAGYNPSPAIPAARVNGLANTGGGGGYTPTAGGNGGSGIVIVEWYE